ncbi:MAG TPA: CAP domain-containing protein [Pyrinomonadaceae bacterium]|nr:CAP domain-containing protein [Pyrinomonadaceae bacterium]
MLLKTTPGQSYLPAIFPILLVMAFITIIPETFAQTPNAAPAKVLVILPSRPAPASRLRPASSPATANLHGPSLNEATAIEKRAFELINEARQSKGLSLLTWDPELCLMARAHSQDMIQRRFFSHETPDGRDTTDRAHAIGIAHFQILGENIAYNQGFEDPGAFAVERWLLSSSHRANILNPQFQASAIGVSVAADGTVFLTQDFITR